MIKDYQVQHKGEEIILGLALENAVMDIVTNMSQLKNCLDILSEPQDSFINCPIGKFGNFQITMNLHHDDTVSIFVDGPSFKEDRVQSFSIWPEKESLKRIIESIIKEG